MDERIGQITHLPSITDTSQGIGDTLMELFHSKTRNMVRKSQKSEFVVAHSEDESVLKTLYTLHTQNLHSMGGRSKPWPVFSAMRDTFRYNDEYRIYFAEYDGQIIATLLLFYYNKTVEYFTPAIHVDFRSKQPMSLLIFEAMCDACKAGFKYWNWGGTWLTQEGVYHFKKHWGSLDHVYKYYCKVNDNTLKKRSQQDLLENYNFFYLLPF